MSPSAMPASSPLGPGALRPAGVQEKSGIDFPIAYGVLEFVKIDELGEVGYRYTKEKLESLFEGKRLRTTCQVVRKETVDYYGAGSGFEALSPKTL